MQQRNCMRWKINKNELFTIPNILSYVRIILAIIFFLVYQINNGNNGVILGLILIVSAITDLLDGKIARKFNQVSELGKLLDPFADKLTQAIILICLMSKYEMVKCVILVFVIKEVCMSAKSFQLIKETKQNEGAQWYGKFSTTVFYIVMIVIILFPSIPMNIVNNMILVSGLCMVMSFVKYMEYFNKKHNKESWFKF